MKAPLNELFPQPAAEDRDVVAREARRATLRDLGELPDIDATLFESVEEYALWLAEGSKRFSKW